MNTETKQCQNCKQSFTIEPDDFLFYAKIQVPLPTFCPKCRFQRRLAFFNLTNLWKRKCDLCGKEKICMYAPEAPYKVYCPQCWWSDNWDPFQYGREYDFNWSFFEQYNELLHEVPLCGLSIDLPTAEAAPFNNHCGHLKNCYFIFFADFSEDCAHSLFIVHDKNILNSLLVSHSELCYDSMHCFKDNRVIGSSHVVESLDCVFSRDLRGCQNCFASASLRNKKYYIFNKPYTKEDYFNEMKKWDLGSYRAYQDIKNRAHEHWKQFAPKPRWNELSVNVSGNYVFESKNCKECFEVTGAQDSKFIFMVTEGPIKDCYDVSSWGNNMELCYECGVVGENVSHIKFCQETGINLYYAEYCKLSTGGSNHFGCVSVKKGDYCILNKRYTKEEFEDLRMKIIKHMNDVPYTDKKGRIYRYGEFFPVELSPNAYNETTAQNFFPLTKEETSENGYMYREMEKREYAITKQAADLPDHIKEIQDDILGEVIGCKNCGRGFKIVPMELQFLRRMNLPLPRECPFCRIEEKFNVWVNELKIVKRACNQCGIEFETSYAQEEAEKTLCKKCYQEKLL